MSPAVPELPSAYERAFCRFAVGRDQRIPRCKNEINAF